MMDWDALERAAFLYYRSRGMTPQLVAGFMRYKCSMAQGPPTTQTMNAAMEDAPFNETTGWDFPSTNAVILQAIAEKNITWEEFLKRLEFNSADRTLLNDHGALNRIEETKRTQDPLVTQGQSSRTSNLGSGSNRSIGAVMDVGGGYVPSPGQMPTVSKRPAADAVDKRDTHGKKRKSKGDDATIEAQNVAMEKLYTERMEEKKKKETQKQVQREKRAKERQDKLEEEARKQREAKQRINDRLEGNEPWHGEQTEMSERVIKAKALLDKKAKEAGEEQRRGQKVGERLAGFQPYIGGQGGRQ